MADLERDREVALLKGTVLFVEDDECIRRVVGAQLLDDGFRFIPADRGAEGLELALRENPSVVLLDLRLPDGSGLDVVRNLRLRNCRVPVVVVTSFGSPTIEREARAVGASHYMEKPLIPAVLSSLVRQLCGSGKPPPARPVIVGNSPALVSALHLVSHLAPTEIPVLIEGESGTGKELVAQVIHYESRRSKGPLVVFDPSSVPETLLESALFGHERGAFTGAVQRSRGVFEQAGGGTLVIDEIGNLPFPVQGKLLRVLQEHRVTPLGASQPLDLDLRILASTNSDLRDNVARGTFRLDLYHRLKGGRIYLPPLRSRADDVNDLVPHFLAEATRETGKSVTEVSPEGMTCLRDYAWPGNVRELRNAVSFAHSMATDTVRHDDLPPELRGVADQEQAEVGLVSSMTLDHIVDEALLKGSVNLKGLVASLICHVEGELLGRFMRGRSQAAVALLVGLDPATISRKLRSLGLSARRQPRQSCPSREAAK